MRRERSERKGPDAREEASERIRLEEELRAAAHELAGEAGSELLPEAEEALRQELAREMRGRLETALREKIRARELAAQAQAALEPAEEVSRFSLRFRIQHMVLLSSCLVLILTGLPLRFPDSSWAKFLFGVTGGVPGSGLIHRIGAAGLIGVGLFHMHYILLTQEGKREFRQLLPRWQDVRDVVANVKYFLGLALAGARFGRFSYVEKFDYWAVYWGMVVMIGTGLMLWFQDRTMAVLPKFALDMASEAHSDEALLATLAIIVWHFYNVHLNPSVFPMSRTWLTGKIGLHELKTHHPLEYEHILARRPSGAAPRADAAQDDPPEVADIAPHAREEEPQDGGRR